MSRFTHKFSTRKQDDAVSLKDAFVQFSLSLSGSGSTHALSDQLIALSAQPLKSIEEDLLLIALDSAQDSSCAGWM
jgi:hypothetical protein